MITEFSDKNFACLGDSITSDEVCGIGTLLCRRLGARLVGNFAHGNATCADWQRDGVRETVPLLDMEPNQWACGNTLSNQVLRLLRHTAPAGQPLCWRHQREGKFSLPAEVGTGLGHTSEIPDVIYIAISTNDGKHREDGSSCTPVTRDTAAVYAQPYAGLTRTCIASALRWAIETLRSAYPEAQIFLATPLQSRTEYEPDAFGRPVQLLKREIVLEAGLYAAVPVIDSYAESGFSALVADNDGIHPPEEWRGRLADFLADRIRQLYVEPTRK